MTCNEVFTKIMFCQRPVAYFITRHKHVIAKTCFLLFGLLLGTSMFRRNNNRNSKHETLLDISSPETRFGQDGYNDSLLNKESIRMKRNVADNITFPKQNDYWVPERGNMPPLALSVLEKMDPKSDPKNNCSNYPNLYTIQFSNIYWQMQQVEDEEYYLYSAYFDMRAQNGSHVYHHYEFAKVRIIAMSNIPNLKMSNSSLKVCQFWFGREKPPAFGNVSDITMIWKRMWGIAAHYLPYIFTCELPDDLDELPLSVSLVPTPCAPSTNNLKISHRDRFVVPSTKSEQKGFGVCVKALDFPSLKMLPRLVEWIETLRILGASKIFFYEYFVDPGVKRMLDYYQSIGIVELTEITLPGELPNQPQLRHLYVQKRMLDKRLNELIPYNDCLYKNMYDYEYITIIDTDEVIIPTENGTWTDLLDKIVNKDIGREAVIKQHITTLCFQNVYFMDEMMDGREEEVASISSDFHMLRHIYRTNTSTNRNYMKCFHSAKETLAVHNHFAIACREPKRCVRHYVSLDRAQMNHYRPTCTEQVKDCNQYRFDTVRDVKLWRYKQQIMENVEMIYKVIK